jgi:chemotaxis protein CheD
MPIQLSEIIQPGQLLVTNNRATVVTVPNVTSGIAVFLFSPSHHALAVGNIPLPDSQQEPNPNWQTTTPAKYADAAIPALWQQLAALGAKLDNSWAKLVGGAQLFNFNGGAGNALNVGSRNLVMVRTGLMQLGIPIETVDGGGNKAKNCQFNLALGQLIVRKLGEKADYAL